MQAPSERRSVSDSIVNMNDITKTGRRELLRKVSLFATLEERDLDIVAKNSELRRFRSGDVIFREGSRGEGLYVIQEGEVHVTKRRADNETMNLAHFLPGESFGELDILEDRPMTATATADTDAVILMFPPQGLRFEDVLTRYPEISARILHELLAFIAGRIRTSNRHLSEKSHWIEELKIQLYSDKLTGLYNRTYIDEEFPRRLLDYGPVTSLLMIKPDNFKTINDTFGHDAGDRALKLIATSIRSQLDERCIMVRYRGDEFAVIAPGMGPEKAMILAEGVRRLVKIISFDHITGGASCTVTASLGVAAYPGHARDPRDLVSICFSRMFRARESGGDRVDGDTP